MPRLSLAPAVQLLRVLCLERLLEVVRSGMYLMKLVLALFNEAQLQDLQGPLEPFRALADPITVRGHFLHRCVVANVAASLPQDVYSTSEGLFRMQLRQASKTRDQTSPWPDTSTRIQS